jgi:4'-phosphopantetheinyl transferase EntD
MFETIFPNCVASCAVRRNALDAGIEPASLFEIEEQGLGKAVPERRLEFRIGRTCARTALVRLGREPVAIPIGAFREPLWPEGVVGSISHCDGLVMAAVANRSDYQSIGIDAEVNQALPCEVFSTVFSEGELNRLNALPSVGVSWDRLVFSVKESVFKTWYPLEKTWLDFTDCDVTIQPTMQMFTAHVSLTPHLNGPLMERSYVGRFVFDDTHLVTAIFHPSVEGKT